MTHAASIDLDATDRRIINALQGGFPLSETPFADAAMELDLREDVLIERVQRLLGSGVLTRFGPLFNADKLGGANVLAAVQVPEDQFDAVADIVNGFTEVSHNYARNHAFNMWFVISVERPDAVNDVIREIADLTGLPVMTMDKREEYFVGLQVNV